MAGNNKKRPTLCPNNLLPLAHYEEIEMLEIVGQGAYGVVRKGRWKNLDVAVKFVNASIDLDYTQQVRFLQSVQHPNIIRYYATTVDPKPGVIMEIANCGSLYTIIHKNDFTYTVAQALDWMLQCAKGIEYLHSFVPKPILHRDIKSPNLLLHNEMKQLKIADFGSSSLFKKTSGRDPNVSTPAWTAPEVFKARSQERYDTKCDVYSWAVSLWEVLSRDIPFQSIGSVQQRIIFSVCMGARPSMTQLKCRDCIKHLMSKCWDQIPNARLPMEEVVRVLTGFLTETDKLINITRSHKSFTHKPFIFLHSMAPSSFSSGVSSSGPRSLPVSEIISENSEAILYTRTENYFKPCNINSQNVGFGVRSYARRASSMNRRSMMLAKKGHYTAAAQTLVGAIKLTKKVHGGSHPNMCLLMKNLALIMKKQGNLICAENTLKKAVEIYEQNWGLKNDYKNEIINTLKEISNVCIMANKIEEGETWLQMAQSHAEQFWGPTSEQVIDVLSSMAYMYVGLDNLEEAEKCFKRILRTYEKYLSCDKEKMIAHLFAMEMVYMKREKYNKAVDLLNNALKIAIPAYGRDHEDLARIHFNLGSLYATIGNKAEAIEQYDSALYIYRVHPTVPTTPMKVAVTNLALANLYAENGNSTVAMKHYQTVLEILPKMLGSNHSNIIKVLTQLASLYKNQANLVKAEWYMQKAVKICDKHLDKAVDPETFLEIGTALCQLSVMYMDLGNENEAETLRQKAVDISKRFNVDMNSELLIGTVQEPNQGKFPMSKLTPGDQLSIMIAATFNGLGVIYSEIKNYSEAEPVLRIALGITGKTLGRSHQDVANVLFNLAKLSRKQKKFCDAEVLYLQAIRIYDTMQMKSTNKDIALKSAHILHSLGKMYAELNDYNPALEFLARALDVRLKWQGGGGQHTADVLLDLAHINKRHQNPEKALIYFKDIIEIYNMDPANFSTETVVETFEYLASLYIELGRGRPAEEIIHRLQRATTPERINKLAKLHYRLARLQEREQNLKMSKKNYKRALKIFEMKEPNQDSDKIHASSTALRLAVVNTTLKNYEKAESLFIRALHLRIEVFGKIHADVADIWKYLANMYRTIGNMEKMKTCIDEATQIENALSRPIPN